MILCYMISFFFFREDWWIKKLKDFFFFFFLQVFQKNIDHYCRKAEEESLIEVYVVEVWVLMSIILV